MNRKGFVLVESIVTAAFVLGMFVFIFLNIMPIIANYDRDKRYDSISSIYDIHMIKKMILKSEETKRVNLVSLPSSGYLLYDNDDICSFVNDFNYCKKLLSRSYLDVSRIIITEYDSTRIKAAKNNFNRQMSEYIKGMQKYNNTSEEDYDYKRRIIVQFNDGRIANSSLLLDGGGGTC